MNANDFYILSYNSYDIIFHIPTSRIIIVKEGTSLYKFFRQLKSNDSLLSAEYFEEFKKLVIDEFDFLKKTEVKMEQLNEINLQTIILPIAGHCNLRCSYCFAQNKGNFGFKDIDVFQAKKIIDYVFSNNNPEYGCHINFFGGEPLLNIITIEETIMYVKKYYPNRKVSFGITTNGTVLNYRILRLIKDNNIKLLLSYDGPKELGSHRTYINGKHTNNRVIKNIELLRREGIHFQLRATIPSDCKNMKDVYVYFESLGIPFAAVIAYKSRNIDDTCIYDEKLDFFQNQYKILFDYYRDRIRNKLPINCYSIVNDILLLKNNEKREYSCGGGVNLFAITDNGNIFSCEHLAFNEMYKIGNINKGISYKKLNKMQPQNVNTIDHCRNCWVRYLCGGGCFSEKILTSQYSGTLPEDECELKRFYWNFILNLYASSEIENTNFGN